MAEVPGGLVVSGLGRVSEREDTLLRPITFEVSDGELAARLHDAEPAPERPPAKRRWLF